MLGIFVLIIFACFFILLALGANWLSWRFISQNGLLQLIILTAILMLATAFFLTQPFAATRWFASVVVQALLGFIPIIVFAHILALLLRNRAMRLSSKNVGVERETNIAR